MTSWLRLLALPLLFLQSLPAAAQAPAPAAEVEPYRVGPSDELAISIYSGAAGEDPLELRFPVAGDGTIDVVHAGRIKVAGLSTSEIQDRIRRGLVSSGFMTKPSVSVNVVEYLSQCVNVTGAVTKQGRFCLRRPTRLLDVLSMAEGVNEEIASSTILVNRQGAGDPIRVDRRALVGSDLAKADAANLRVLAGDNIHVPVKARFCINGPVEAGGCYPFEEGATIQAAFSMAGGLKTDLADRRNITLRRHNGIEMKIDMDALEQSGAALPLLEPDDQIVVGAVEILRFCVTGEVEEPDCYDYVRGLTIEGAISKAGGFTAGKADRNQVLVRRDTGEGLQEIRVDIDDPTERGARFIVQADDQITVPKLDCLVSVGGGVRETGQVELTTGMTIVDALNEAGGTNDESGFLLGKLTAVRLTRGGKVQEIDVRAILRGVADDVPLRCGDKIYVPPKAMGRP